MADILRTPDGRFTNLPDYPWAPNYVDVKTPDFPAVRMHWIEAGSGEVGTVLLLHGEPSWSFLYRKMIPTFERAGFRAIAPDLIGFGKSDKPADRNDYTYARHVGWILSFMQELELEGVHMVCQDWGGLIGLRLLGTVPERFAAVVASNTFLPTGTEPVPRAFRRWLEFSQQVPELPIGGVLDMATVSELPPEVLAAYEAPFPDESFKAGARQFPALVPIAPDAPGAAENRLAWETLEHLPNPVLCAFGDSDPITGGAAPVLAERIAGAKGRPHVTIQDAGHFIQEDKGEELAEVAVEFFSSLTD